MYAGTPDGKKRVLIGTVGVIRDITERKIAGEEIKRKSEHLEALNKDLDAFTYSVSHDLRAPLRTIDSFTKIMTEDHQDRLDEEGLRVLNVIINNTKKDGAAHRKPPGLFTP